MDMSHVNVDSLCQQAADKALVVVRLWSLFEAYPHIKEGSQVFRIIGVGPFAR